MDCENAYQFIVIAIFFLAPLIKQLVTRGKEANEAQPFDEADLDWDDWQEELEAGTSEAESEASLPPAPVAAPAADLAPAVIPVAPHAEERRKMIAAFDAFLAEADALEGRARIDRATQPMALAIADYVVPRARHSRNQLVKTTDAIDYEQWSVLGHLQAVFGAIEVLIQQRQIAHVREALGDADAIAHACYLPVLDFARVNLPELTSAQPVSLLTPFSLSIWTGFIPTGLAPLFLPPDFFADLRWWPALAHEIGHDFLAATVGAEDQLRDELGLPDQRWGQRLLSLAGNRLHPDELFRIFGAWFEETFCDVFGTMMLGPAYGYTMVELFAEPDAPDRTATVQLDASGRRYDIHPPRALRVQVVARVLTLMDEDEAADEIRSEWTEIHGDQQTITFPVAGAALGLPFELIAAIAGDLVERLYTTQFDGLDGHALSDIPGLEYGTHRAAEARRARDELLSGRPPSQHRPRAVVAGAVLAWRQARDRHDQILALARRAIVGVTETREDRYSAPQPGSGHLPGGQKTDLREAFLLHTVLSPPPSLARLRPRTQSASFLSRRTWP